MQHLNLWLERYGERRVEILSNWSHAVEEVENLKGKIPCDVLFDKVERHPKPDYRMCFIDGGEGLRELMGLGVYFIKASGLTLEEQSDLGENFTRDLDMNFIDYNQYTKERVELLRDCMEYDTAIHCIEKQKPDIVFLDGSLYVKAYKKPIYCGEYQLYRKKYWELIKVCINQGICLVGISEDSKSRLLSHHISRAYGVDLPKYMTDSSLLQILNPYKAFQTMEFTPKNIYEPGKLDYALKNILFPTTYLQPTPHSVPLRIDYLNTVADSKNITSIIAALCQGSGNYGYPLPLYIAHLDARIKPKQMDWTVKQLVSYVTKNNRQQYDPILRQTRRLTRPHTMSA